VFDFGGPEGEVWGDGGGIGTEAGREVEILVAVVGAGGRGRRGGSRRILDPGPDLGSGGFPHAHRAGARGDGFGEEEVAPGAGIAEAARDAGGPAFEGGSRRVREDQGGVEGERSQPAGDRPGGFAGVEGQERIDGGVRVPQVGEFPGREEGDLGVGECRAEPQEGGGGHHRVAEPVQAANQDAAGWWGEGGHGYGHGGQGEGWFMGSLEDSRITRWVLEPCWGALLGQRRRAW
jgi:hypothetical protein